MFPENDFKKEYKGSLKGGYVMHGKGELTLKNGRIVSATWFNGVSSDHLERQLARIEQQFQENLPKEQEIVEPPEQDNNQDAQQQQFILQRIQFNKENNPESWLADLKELGLKSRALCARDPPDGILLKENQNWGTIH